MLAGKRPRPAMIVPRQPADLDNAGAACVYGRVSPMDERG